jgi:redox-sensitive bicupin YhaK (pirin superfamily)
MKSVLHKANSRGHADHGWLKTYYSFSFADYYNPERMHFGVLRVLNDDYIAGGQGFGMHPHDNMEIITIPLEGALEHKDSMGNTGVIRKGDVQVMSAGTGIYHSEFNHEKDLPCTLFQIWLFPNKQNVKPRYDQLTFKLEDRKNKLQQILTPFPDDEGVWIHQDAWFHLANLDNGKTIDYNLKDPKNGVYVLVIEGQISVEGQALGKRDGLGVWEISSLTIEAGNYAEILLMEIPMKV